jgi:hypothetical protein
MVSRNEPKHFDRSKNQHKQAEDPGFLNFAPGFSSPRLNHFRLPSHLPGTNDVPGSSDETRIPDQNAAGTLSFPSFCSGPHLHGNCLVGDF